MPSDSPERPARTKKFQQINDAYYTLSDPTRRRDYDAARTYHFGSEGTSEADEEIPRPTGSGGGGFPWSAFGFGGAQPSGSASQEEQFSNEQFGSVFEEMLREEGLAEGAEARPTGKFWSIVGGLSGGAMGFIIANFPGAVAGLVVGNVSLSPSPTRQGGAPADLIHRGLVPCETRRGRASTLSSKKCRRMTRQSY